jgi:hypothetical protein
MQRRGANAPDSFHRLAVLCFVGFAPHFSGGPMHLLVIAALFVLLSKPITGNSRPGPGKQARLTPAKQLAC